jgi:TctA family transporter
MSGGDFGIFFTRPLCVALLVASAAVLAGAAFKLAPKQLRTT